MQTATSPESLERAATPPDLGTEREIAAADDCIATLDDVECGMGHLVSMSDALGIRAAARLQDGEDDSEAECERPTLGVRFLEGDLLMCTVHGSEVPEVENMQWVRRHVVIYDDGHAHTLFHYAYGVGNRKEASGEEDSAGGACQRIDLDRVTSVERGSDTIFLMRSAGRHLRKGSTQKIHIFHPLNEQRATQLQWITALKRRTPARWKSALSSQRASQRSAMGSASPTPPRPPPHEPTSNGLVPEHDTSNQFATSTHTSRDGSPPEALAHASLNDRPAHEAVADRAHQHVSPGGSENDQAWTAMCACWRCTSTRRGESPLCLRRQQQSE